MVSTEENETWETAHQLIRLLGPEAEIAAADRADKALGLGDIDGFHRWRRITWAIAELERLKRRAGDALN